MKSKSAMPVPASPLPQNPPLLPFTPPRVRRAEWILALIACLAIVVIVIARTVYVMGSDQAATVLSGALVIREGSFFLDDWRYPGEIYTVPTTSPAPLYGLLYVLSGSSYLARLIGTLLLSAAGVASMVYLLRPLGVRTPHALLGASLMFSRVGIHGTVWFYYSVLIIFGLITMGYWLRLWMGRRGRTQTALTVLLPLVAFAQGMCSPRQLLFYGCLFLWAFAPVLLRAWRDPGVHFSRLFPGCRVWLEPLGWLAANGLGYFLFFKTWPLAKTTVDFMTRPYEFASTAEWGKRFSLFFKALPEMSGIRLEGTRLDSLSGAHIFMLAGLTILLIRLAPSLWRTCGGWAHALGMNSLVWCVIVGLLLFTTFLTAEEHPPRYFFWILPLAAVTASLALEWCRRNGRNHWLLAGSLLAIVSLRLHPMDVKRFTHDIVNPPAMRKAGALRDYLDRHGLTNGYATYWNSLVNEASMNEAHRITPLHDSHLKSSKYHTQKWRYSPEYAPRNVFLLLSPKEEEECLGRPKTANLLASGRKLAEPVPESKFAVYVFEDNPFIEPSSVLDRVGGSFLFKPAGPNFIPKGPHTYDGGAVDFDVGAPRGFDGPYLPVPEGKYRVLIRYLYPVPPTDGKTKVRFNMGIFRVSAPLAVIDLPPDRATVEIAEMAIGPDCGAILLKLQFLDKVTPFRIEEFKLTRLP